MIGRIISISIIVVTLCYTKCISQGHNHNWLMGYLNDTTAKGVLSFTNTTMSFVVQNRDIPFNGTQGNFSDNDGNLLATSNGQWIANSSGSLMMNGHGLNPNAFTASHPKGLFIVSGNLIIENPGDSTQLLLIHQTGENTPNLESNTLFMTTIDMTLDGGLGGVTIKNQMSRYF